MDSPGVSMLELFFFARYSMEDSVPVSALFVMLITDAPKETSWFSVLLRAGEDFLTGTREWSL
ncbi:hypothetical protein [Arthrobacter sp. H35-D1]|uniref:hypothetical protein n=1 Tax=Arthrobacter sp. H35-D1 TaxID=3046202 RepID=UPI0024BB7A5C|nr:hypothetical protein [Arthrobacter sp. H35-D1]MDJ0313284.1 hypothetical protein [Arthrobacter sp. H35-D1]